jgi:hypothetical protein
MRAPHEADASTIGFDAGPSRHLPTTLREDIDGNDGKVRVHVWRTHVEVLRDEQVEGFRVR